jgi:uncharacterized sporulation protein YeaH/YhbH (DUF444 family)
MSFEILDRRDGSTDSDKSSGSRQKFIKRNKRALKEALDGVINSADGITDIIGGAQNKRKKFNIKGIEEPTFGHEPGGDQEHAITGNERFSVGDLIEKPRQGQGGGGGEPGEDGEGEDDFAFYLDRKEFLDLLFEDLELPELVKQSLLNMNNTERERSGLVTDGPPAQLDLVRTFRNSLGRRIGLKRGPLKEAIALLEEELRELTLQLVMLGTVQDIDPERPQKVAQINDRMIEVSAEIAKLKKKMKRIPFLDPLDLRYRNYQDVPKPSMSAAMFNIMDVSGSMTEHHKACAKVFFFLLYMFLQKNYEKVAVIFIRHTSEAKEVDENEFFYGRETGGTLIAPALELMLDIVKERFDIAHWNLYCAQASDGDSFGSDAETCRDLIMTKILPIFQYMVYIQIDDGSYDEYGSSSSSPTNPLWTNYAQIADASANFEMQCVADRHDIYPVFKKMFEKKN